MPPLASIGVAIYKMVLGLYPRAFRREFTSDMIQDFEDATREAWADRRWTGVLSLWWFLCADGLGNVPIQWLRSGTLITAAVAFVSASLCAAVVGMLDLRVPYMIQPNSPEREGVLILVMITTVVVIIAATLILSLMFLRPAFDRHAGRRRV